MEGFTPRDYVVSALIIVGVLLVWFLLMASLMGIGTWQITLPIAIVISCVMYVFIKRREKKP